MGPAGRSCSIMGRIVAQRASISAQRAAGGGRLLESICSTAPTQSSGASQRGSPKGSSARGAARRFENHQRQDADTRSSPAHHPGEGMTSFRPDIPFIASPNCSSRRGQSVCGVVIHYTGGGSASGTIPLACQSAIARERTLRHRPLGPNCSDGTPGTRRMARRPGRDGH